MAECGGVLFSPPRLSVEDFRDRSRGEDMDPTDAPTGGAAEEELRDEDEEVGSFIVPGPSFLKLHSLRERDGRIIGWVGLSSYIFVPDDSQKHYD